jgi:hypothetical protein
VHGRDQLGAAVVVGVAAEFDDVNFTCSVAFSVRITVWNGVSSPVVVPSSSLKTQLACTSMRRFSRLRKCMTTSRRPSSNVRAL